MKSFYWLALGWLCALAVSAAQVELNFDHAWQPAAGLAVPAVQPNGAATIIPGGHQQSALHVEAKGYVTAPLSAPQAGTATLRFWVRPAHLVEGLSNYIVSLVNSKAEEPPVAVVRMNGNKLDFCVLEGFRAGKAVFRSVFAKHELPVGQWSYVVAVKDAEGLRLYLNGALENRLAQPAPLPAADTLIIGRGPVKLRERDFTGDIDTLLYTDAAWSSAQVAQEHAAASPGGAKTADALGHKYLLVEFPARDARFPKAPARVRVNLDYMQGLLGSAVPIDPARLTVQPWDKAAGQPQGTPLHPRLTPNAALDEITLGWQRPENEAAIWAIGLAEQAPQRALGDNQPIPLVGTGEAVSVGRADLLAEGQGLASYPIAVDWDHDGDLDLLAAFVIPKHVYFFENLANKSGVPPVLAAPRVVLGGQALERFDLLALPDGHFRVYMADKKSTNILVLNDTEELGVRKFKFTSTLSTAPWLKPGHSINDLALADYNGDGVRDLLVGVSEGNWWWPNGIDPWNKGLGNPDIGYGRGYDSRNRWLGKPPVGSFYVLINQGSDVEPNFAAGRLIEVGGQPLRMETTQWTANLVDMNEDALPDLLLGTDVDRQLVCYNTGKRGEPKFDYPVNALLDSTASRYNYFDSRFEIVDWDGDGKLDVLTGSNPGLVVECKIEQGKLREQGILQARGGNVWAETLVVPDARDFDGDGVWDLVMGDSSGFLSFFHNAGTGQAPLFTKREKLKVGGKIFQPVAGYSGSIHGPDEARWGYLAPTVCDWDGDGRLDVVVSDITGYVYWLWNHGTKQQPELADPQPLKVGTWPLKVRWRTRPAMVPGKPLPDLLTSDDEGFMTLYRRDRLQGPEHLVAGEPVLDQAGQKIKLDGPSGYNGRTKFFITDWDRDGVWDVLAGEPGRSGIRAQDLLSIPREPRATVVWWKNVGTAEKPVMATAQTLLLANGERLEYGVHSCAPTVLDVDGDGWDDMFIGSETGFVHYFNRSTFEDASQLISIPASHAASRAGK